MMRRTVIGTGTLLTILAVPACGSGALTGAASHSATTAPVASQPTNTPAVSQVTATVPAACLASRLVLGFGPPVSPMTGEHAVLYRLTNRGATACLLRGYPAVTLVGAHGAALAFHYTRGHSPYVAHTRPSLVTVTPGGSAYFLVAKYRCDLGGVADAVSVTVGLPDGGSLTGPVAPTGGVATLSLCRGGASDPGQGVDVSPFASTARATLPG